METARGIVDESQSEPEFGFTMIVDAWQNTQVEESVDVLPSEDLTLGGRSNCLPLQLLELQNQPYPKNWTDCSIQCSNGFIRVHGLLLRGFSKYIEDMYVDGNQILTSGELVLNLEEVDVLDMAKIIFIFYTGRTMIDMLKRPEYVKILKKLGCPQDQLYCCVPFKHTKNYEETHLKQIGDVRLQIWNSNSRGGEETYFISLRGEIEGRNPFANAVDSMSLPVLTPQVLSIEQNRPMPSEGQEFRSSRSREEDIVITCSEPECRIRVAMFYSWNDFDAHVENVHPGKPNTKVAIEMTCRPMRTSRSQPDHAHAHPQIRNTINKIMPNSERSSSVPSPRPGPSRTVAITPLVEDLSRIQRSTGKRAGTPYKEVPVHKKPRTEVPQINPIILNDRFPENSITESNRCWYCVYCHFGANRKALLTLHMEESHPDWNDEDEANGPILYDSADLGKLENLVCLICPNGADQPDPFCSISAIGLELHTQKAHGVIHEVHFELLPKPKCRCCNKNRVMFDQCSLFFNHLNSCLEKKRESMGNQWNPTGKVSKFTSKLPKSPGARLWYHNVYLQISSPDFSPDFLGKLVGPLHHTTELPGPRSSRSRMPADAAKQKSPEKPVRFSSRQRQRQRLAANEENTPAPLQERNKLSPIFEPQMASNSKEKPKARGGRKPGQKNKKRVGRPKGLENKRNKELEDEDQGLEVQDQELEVQDQELEVQEQELEVQDHNRYESTPKPPEDINTVIVGETPVNLNPSGAIGLRNEGSPDISAVTNGITHVAQTPSDITLAIEPIPGLSWGNRRSPLRRESSESQFASASDVWFDDVDGEEVLNIGRAEVKPVKQHRKADKENENPGAAENDSEAPPSI